jgi:very-short-patch-repair endonuclease
MLDKTELEKSFESFNERITLQCAFHYAPDIRSKIRIVTDFWRNNEAEIIEYNKTHRFKWFRSYPFDWSQIHTPIEADAWISIRRKGKVVLYPQFPVLGYRVDFANPAMKIALELDGKDFHKDKSKDQQRDVALAEAGWTVFRITGKEMWRNNYKDFSDFEEDWLENNQEDIEDWIMNTGDGVIEAIRAVYFIRQEPLTEHLDTFLRFCYKSLDKHCTTDSFDPYAFYETQD